MGYLGPVEKAFAWLEFGADSPISSSGLVGASHHMARADLTHICIHSYAIYTVKVTVSSCMLIIFAYQLVTHLIGMMLLYQSAVEY